MLHQRRIFPLAATLAVTVLAACGGGGSSAAPSLPASGPGTVASTPVPTAPPVATATPTPPATATPALVTATLAGSPGFINKASHTVYVFDADLAAAGTSTCTSQCATVWPPIAVPQSAAVSAPFSVIARSDGTFQLAYSGRPLYTYIADSAPGTTAGDGITSFGATWHIARPAAGTSTPAPSASNPPISSY